MTNATQKDVPGIIAREKFGMMAGTECVAGSTNHFMQGETNG
jgi:hypothetical protein